MSGVVYILIALGVLAILIAIANFAPAQFKRTFYKYNKVNNSLGISADQFALAAVEYSPYETLEVARIKGELTDAYIPKLNTIALSETTIGNTSVAALAVVAHEYGHAIQKNSNSTFFNLTHYFGVITGFLSKLSVPIFLVGLILWVFVKSQEGLGVTLMYIGVIIVIVAFLYQLFTIPIEFDASKKGLKYLADNEVLNAKELRIANKVLRAAGMTYVASFLATMLAWTFLVPKYKK